MRYKAVIFDVTDTLAEFTPNWAKIYGDRMRLLGFEVSEEMAINISRNVYYKGYEQTQREQNGEAPLSNTDNLRLRDDAALSCVLADSKKRNRLLNELSQVPIPKQTMIAMQGVYDVLNRLQELKYRLAIVSNYQVTLPEVLKDIGLFSYFETIIVSEIVGIEKPNTKIMKIALDEMKIDAQDCLYVGDQPLDVLCAKQAGIDCVWLTPNDNYMPEYVQAKEDYKIEKLHQLLNILVYTIQ